MTRQKAAAAEGVAYVRVSKRLSNILLPVWQKSLGELASGFVKEFRLPFWSCSMRLWCTTARENSAMLRARSITSRASCRSAQILRIEPYRSVPSDDKIVQHIGELEAGELAALVRVENLGPAVLRQEPRQSPIAWRPWPCRPPCPPVSQARALETIFCPARSRRRAC